MIQSARPRAAGRWSGDRQQASGTPGIAPDVLLLLPLARSVARHRDRPLLLLVRRYDCYLAYYASSPAPLPDTRSWSFPAGFSWLFNAMRDRNSLERTVFTGIRSSAAMSE